VKPVLANYKVILSEMTAVDASGAGAGGVASRDSIVKTSMFGKTYSNGHEPDLNF